MPIGAMITRDWIWRKAYGNLDKFLLHTSTFGGNTRACAAGIAALRLLLKSDWIENAARMGEKLLAGLELLKSKFSILKDVRGKGLMIGLSLARFKGNSPLIEGALSLYIVRHLLKRHRIITSFTLNNLDVLRMAPPLFIGQSEVDKILNGLEDALASAQKFNRFRWVSDTALSRTRS